MSLGSRYRPEIDGLRAVAVIGVVFYHLGLGLPGGYVGVDVFFVISGYLITQKLSRELASGRFSLKGFWLNRARRLFPAMAVLLIMCLVAGYFILIPKELLRLADSMIAQILLVANIHIWRAETGGYFSEAAELNPLLHMWSLAVEEQFYLIFPVVIAVFYRFWKSFLIPFLCVIGVVSFALSVWATFHAPSANFYLLPTRAWELIAGALLALSIPRKPLSKLYGELASWGGLLLIVGSICFYDSHTSFPGLLAIPPVLGTCLVIMANKLSLTTLGRWLSIRPLVFVGLISYSLYLWHWPVIALTRHMVLDLNLYWSLGCLVVLSVLAFLSWKYVELPFRRGCLSSYKRISSFAVCSLTIVLLGCIFVESRNGMPERYGHDHQMIIQDWSSESADFGGYLEKNSTTPILLGNQDGLSHPSFVLWGDSHAGALIKIFDEQADALGLSGLAFIRGSSLPVTGLNTDQERELSEYNAKVFDKIVSSGATEVVLVARWSSYIEGRSQAELAVKRALFEPGLMVPGDTKDSIDKNRSSRLLHEQLLSMAERFKQEGIRLRLIKQAPETDCVYTARDFHIAKHFPMFNRMPPQYTVSRTEHNSRQAGVNLAIDSIPAKTITVINPTDKFFESGDRLKVYNERAYYRDDNHLTEAGVEHYFTDLVQQTLQRIKLASLPAREGATN